MHDRKRSVEVLSLLCSFYMHESNAIYIYSPAMSDRRASRALDRQGGEVGGPLYFVLVLQGGEVGARGPLYFVLVAVEVTNNFYC